MGDHVRRLSRISVELATLASSAAPACAETTVLRIAVLEFGTVIRETGTIDY